MRPTIRRIAQPVTRMFVGLSLVVLASHLAPTASPASRSVTAFANGTWRDHLTSTLTMHMDFDCNGSTDETVNFQNVLDLIRLSPFTNLQGFREIDMQIVSWTATGHSTFLNSDIQFRLSNVPQPTSAAVADQQGADYPATISFNTLYDTYVDGVRVAQSQQGTAVGHGFMVIPPDGTVALMVSKFFEAVCLVGATPCSACGDTTFPYGIRIDAVSTLSVSRTQLSWVPVTGEAVGHDVVRGDLATLRSTAGDFAASTEQCLVNSSSITFLPYGANPLPGQGFWFLERDEFQQGVGTYDDEIPRQIGSRNREIVASPSSCP